MCSKTVSKVDDFSIKLNNSTKIELMSIRIRATVNNENFRMVDETIIFAGFVK